MDLYAKHAGFVIAAYGLSAAVLLVMILAVVIRDRKLAIREAETDGH